MPISRPLLVSQRVFGRFASQSRVNADVDLWLLLTGQTELPTCPVCLERLDEHISGVVTTVSPYHVMLDAGSCLLIAASKELGSLLLQCAH